MDPHAVLGLEPGASPEEVQRAYRALAKRFHPDRAGEAAGDLMVSINAAHDMLRDQLTNGVPGGPPAGAPREPRRRAVAQGDWLAPAVRKVLARELLTALEPGEQVDEVVLTATSDSHDVQLAVTDRRLLWLRDDAIVGRVRYLRYGEVTRVEGRAGRLRRLGHLCVRSVGGRRLRFFELRPELLRRVERAIVARWAP